MVVDIIFRSPDSLPVDSRGFWEVWFPHPALETWKNNIQKKSADPARPPHAVGDGTGWSTWRHAQPLACTASARAKSNATANTYAAWPAVVSCDVPTRRAPWMINRSASACSLRCKVRSHRTYRNQPISMDRPGDSTCPRLRVRTPQEDKNHGT